MRLLEKRRYGQTGYSIVELSVSLAIFAVILVMTTFIMAQAKSAWVVNNSEEAASVRLRTALGPLQRDFSLGSHENIAQAPVPASLGGGGKDGDALWFLSPIDPGTKEMVRNTAGEPVWQRNILYYLSVPLDHYGCAGTLGPDGYDEGCPHKVMVRKVINNPAADGTQALLKNASAHLGRPSSNTATGPLQPGVEESHIIGSNLLWFRVLPNPTGGEGARFIDARAVAIDAAQRIAQAGLQRHANSPSTVHSQLPVTAHN